ncbi:MAG: hypothetical protein HWN67_18880 [Candidatus Helarchaeota archaeon]|nr:hypothetical protein [Candidatus Helarchaeota archaeon]
MYVPESGEIEFWERSSKPLLFDSSNLFDLIDGSADVYLEYGFENAVNQEYIKDDTLSIVINIFKMKSSESAYGIFSFGRRPGLNIIRIGDMGYETEFNISFCKGSFYVVVESFLQNNEVKDARREFAENISRKIKEKGEIPSIFKILPEEKSVANSEKYINGIISLNNIFFISDENILDIGNSCVGAYKEYSVFGRNVKLIIVKYNENQKKAFYDLINYFKKSDGYINYSEKQKVNIWQKKNGKYVLLKRVKNFIIIAFDVHEKRDGMYIINAVG